MRARFFAEFILRRFTDEGLRPFDRLRVSGKVVDQDERTEFRSW